MTRNALHCATVRAFIVNMPRWVVLSAVIVLGATVCAGRLSGNVTPDNSSADGADWCQPLKPCNETKTNAVRIESGYGTGLLNQIFTPKVTFQYASTTPATAMDWRTALTDWDVRDQGSCGASPRHAFSDVKHPGHPMHASAGNSKASHHA